MLHKAFDLVDGGLSFQEAAKRTGVPRSSLCRKYSKHLSSRIDEKRATLRALKGENEELERRVDSLNSELGGIRAQRSKLESVCGTRGLTLERCLAAVQTFDDLNAEVLKRRKTLQRWDTAISEKQRHHDELERRIPRLEESEKGGKFALQAIQKLYFDTVNGVQYFGQQLSILEQETNARNEMVMVLHDEAAKARADFENVVRAKKEGADQLVGILNAVQRAKEELKMAEGERDSMLASVGDWIKVKADERVNEAAETLRIRLAALGVNTQET